MELISCFHMEMLWKWFQIQLQLKWNSYGGDSMLSCWNFVMVMFWNWNDAKTRVGIQIDEVLESDDPALSGHRDEELVQRPVPYILTSYWCFVNVVGVWHHDSSVHGSMVPYPQHWAMKTSLLFGGGGVGNKRKNWERGRGDKDEKERRWMIDIWLKIGLSACEFFHTHTQPLRLLFLFISLSLVLFCLLHTCQYV